MSANNKTAVNVAHKYTPRRQFASFHGRTQRWAIICAHRRAGKTVAVVNDMVIRALRTRKLNAFYAYVAPYFGQAKQVAWTYIKQAVENIPGVKIHEATVMITLPNGARIRVFGADNADALRGLYFDGIVLDEFGDMARSVWTEVIRPALSDRQGWAVFIGTPKAKNAFYDIWVQAKKPENRNKWFSLQLKASESGILPASELADIREELDEDEYAQEMECSFEATSRGSYFGKLMQQLDINGQIANFEIDYDEPVSCSWDIGYRDATAVWFWQVIDGRLLVIDYLEFVGKDAEEALDTIELKPYHYETMWLPHDAKNKTFATKKTVVDTFIARQQPARLVKDIKFSDGIDAVRKTLRTYPIVFHAKNCARGLEALRNYSRKWNADAKVFANTPDHNEWSHGADSFRYLSTVVNPTTIAMSKERASRKRQPVQIESTLVLSPQTGSLTVNTRYTFADALRDHDRAQSRKRSAGRSRI